MKKNFFKVVALSCATVMLAFVGCSKEDGGHIEAPNQGVKAALKISLENPVQIQSRAIESEDGSSIGDVTVLITNIDNRIINKYWYESASELSEASENGNIETTTLAKRVYIVGNISSSSSTVDGAGVFASTGTLQAAQAVLYDLSSISASSLPIFGTVGSDLAFANVSGEMVASTSVNMKLIPARIDVYVNNNMTDYDQPDAVELDGVGAFFTASQTFLIPNAGSFIPSGVATSSLLSAWEDNSSDVWVPSPGVSSQPAGFLSHFSHTFYVFPSSEKDLIVAVKSTFKEGNETFAGEARYYPVHFNTADVGNVSLENGKRYILSINLNGDANDGTGGGGTDNPDIPVTNSELTISLTPASWEVVNVTDPKEFD